MYQMNPGHWLLVKSAISTGQLSLPAEPQIFELFLLDGPEKPR